MAKLPMDIILEEILPRVHAKYLLNIKLVCKSFNTTISNPEFSSRHLRHSIASNTSRLLIIKPITNRGRDLHVFDIDSLESPPSYIIALPEYNLHYFGSCNGILCLGKKLGEFFVLLNSLTRKSFKVPKYPNILYGPQSFRTKFEFGFGFDSTNNDYKIVWISDKHDGRREVIVYSLRAKSWRVLDNVVEYKDDFRIYNNAAVSGALINTRYLHWVFAKANTSGIVWSHRIRCFDVTTEEWANDVPLPPNDCLDMVYMGDDVQLGILDGCLSLSVSVNSRHVINPIEIWVMKEYRVRESWAKLLVIANKGNVFRVFSLGYPSYGSNRGRDEILVARVKREIEVYKERVGIKWYNSKDITLRVSEIHDKVFNVHEFYDAFTSTGSLVPIIGPNPIPEE